MFNRRYMPKDRDLWAKRGQIRGLTAPSVFPLQTGELRAGPNVLVGISSAFIEIVLCFALLQDRPIRTCPALV